MKPDKDIHHYSIFLIAGLLLSGCFFSPYIPPPPEKVSSVKEFETYLQKLVDNGVPTGLSFIAIKNGEIVYSKGFGWADRPKKIKATPETIYHWWSITKIVTAIAVMQLHEQGKLNLNDPVIQFLPYFQVEYPSDTSKPVTILNLLNHSSGIPDPGVDLINWVHHDGTPSVNQNLMLEKVLPDYSELLFEPGSRASYTNTGYMVLGAIIEKVSGKSYEDYIRENIFKPLKMKHTDFVYSNEEGIYEAAGAHSLDDRLTPVLLLMVPTYIREIDEDHLWMKRVYTLQTPPTAVIGPATDAARLTMAYLNGGELEGNRILSEQTVKMMSTEGYIKGWERDSLNFFRNGIGWFIFSKDGTYMIKHEGGGPGFRTIMQIYPDEKTGFVLLSNDMNTRVGEITELAAKIEW